MRNRRKLPLEHAHAITDCVRGVDVERGSELLAKRRQVRSRAGKAVLDVGKGAG